MANEIKHLSTADFDVQIGKATPTLVDFWATWCGPCKMLAPVLQEVASVETDVEFAKIDVDEEEDIARKYGVMSIPTLVIFKNGKEIARSVGYKNPSQLKAFIDDNK